MKEQVLKAMREAGKPVSAGDIAKALGADRKETDTYQVHLIEEEFLKQMWSGETV